MPLQTKLMENTDSKIFEYLNLYILVTINWKIPKIFTITTVTKAINNVFEILCVTNLELTIAETVLGNSEKFPNIPVMKRTNNGPIKNKSIKITMNKIIVYTKKFSILNFFIFE